MSYSSGHPWYYVLGGKPLFPSQIKARINLETYPDLMVEDILKASKMAEPKRSERLRAIRLKTRASLSTDLNRYLECVRDLKNLRVSTPLDADPKCEDIHQSMSLKHNHIYNDYAQLMICESHLAKQADLFAFA
jgi:hypothetical protein